MNPLFSVIECVMQKLCEYESMLLFVNLFIMIICMQVPFRIVEIGENIFIAQTSHGVEPLFCQGPSISWFERLHEVLCSGMAWARYYRTDGHAIHARMWGSNYSHFSIHDQNEAFSTTRCSPCLRHSLCCIRNLQI